MENSVDSETKINIGMDSFLPDYILMEILGRLQLKYIVQFYCVCKRWRDLLKDREFSGMFKLTAMVVDEPTADFKQYFLVKSEDIRISSLYFSSYVTVRIHCYPSYRTDFSQNGFLFMRSVCGHIVLIVNPIESFGVKVFCPKKSKAYGIYFNKKLNEHCVLFGVRIRSRNCIIYSILTLGANPHWKNLENQWNNYRPKFEKSCSEWARPISIGDCIYWWVVPDGQPNVIMEFNTTNEEFSLMQNLPRNTNTTSLLNIHGVLSLVHISIGISHIMDIEIWTLKKPQSWTRSNYSKITPKKFWHRSVEGPKPIAKPIAVVDGELFLQFETTFFALNLEKGTICVCGKSRHSGSTRLFSHNVCTLSLKKCKPVICMKEVDEKMYMRSCEFCGKLEKEGTSSSNTGIQQAH